jgi:integrase
MQYEDPDTGRLRRRTTQTANRRDAERCAAQWEREIKAGADWSSGRLDWNLFRDRFRAEYLQGLAPRSREKAEQVLDGFGRIVCPKKLRDAKEATLSKYQKDLRDRGRRPATIKGNLAYIRSALSWALNNKLIDKMPTFPQTPRAKSSAVMKGRPITTEEFERMTEAVNSVILKPNLSKKKTKAETDTERAGSWVYLLKGLWLSGFRLGEAMELHWTDRTKINVDLSLRLPMVRIPAGSEKGNRDRILPMTPDFAMFLAETPQANRRGYVFNPLPLLAVHGQELPGRMRSDSVGKIIAKIGQSAKVVVDWRKDEEEAQPAPIYASAHDLRRSFGERWAGRLMPKELMELMRHASIETTMRYYVGQNAEKTAGILWERFGPSEARLGAVFGAESKKPATGENDDGEKPDKNRENRKPAAGVEPATPALRMPKNPFE